MQHEIDRLTNLVEIIDRDILDLFEEISTESEFKKFIEARKGTRNEQTTQNIEILIKGTVDYARGRFRDLNASLRKGEEEVKFLREQKQKLEHINEEIINSGDLLNSENTQLKAKNNEISNRNKLIETTNLELNSKIKILEEQLTQISGEFYGNQTIRITLAKEKQECLNRIAEDKHNINHLTKLNEQKEKLIGKLKNTVEYLEDAQMNVSIEHQIKKNYY